MSINTKKQALVILYVISVILAYTTDFLFFKSIYIKYIVSFFWIILFGFSYHNSNKKGKEQNQIKYCIALMIPYFVLIIYSLFLYVSGINTDVGFRNFTRQVSSSLYLFLAYSFTLVGFYFFKSKVLKYLIIGGTISYVVFAIIPSVFNNDLYLFVAGLLTGQVHEGTYLEVHDLTFGFGLLFLYYFLFERQRSPKTIFLLLLLIILGWKRIQFLAILACLIIFLIILKKTSDFGGRIGFVAFGVAFSSLFFVYSVKSGLFEQIVNSFGLNTMGRITYYNYASNYYDFGLFYLGKGYMWFYRLFQQLRANDFRIDGYLIPASIHSDILCMYIEYGMVMFILYILYNFIFIPSFLRNRYGKKSGIIFCLFNLYMFVLYFTDNVSNYFISQSIFIVLPLVFYEEKSCGLRRKTSKTKIVLRGIAYEGK